MKLRLILLILAVSAFLFACFGTFLYYSSLKNTARLEAKRHGTLRIDTLQSALSSYLNEYKKPAKTLTQLPELKNALIMPNNTTLKKANVILDNFQHSLKAEVCYLMNRDGLTVASSNRYAPDSFLGQNFIPAILYREHGRPAVHVPCPGHHFPQTGRLLQPAGLQLFRLKNPRRGRDQSLHRTHRIPADHG
jgi:C4-dicarboxylate-specific signal transduction histidine kinase